MSQSRTVGAGKRVSCPRAGHWLDFEPRQFGLGIVVPAPVCCQYSYPENQKSRFPCQPGGEFMRRLILASFAAAVLLAPGLAVAQEPIIIKFSHVVANDTPKGKGALK